MKNQKGSSLVLRVREIFILLENKPALKEKAATIIHNGLSTCDDRIILALDDLETMQILQKAEDEEITEESLKEIGKSFFFLERVDAKAKEHMKTLTWVDEIEVQLALRLSLVDHFKLPFSIIVACSLKIVHSLKRSKSKSINKPLKKN
ncbi:MAG: hypothetical protein H7A38_03485 [Chlamydiales bacterium]|nr:hypothetical protein [Chlamydiales bacterium]